MKVSTLIALVGFGVASAKSSIATNYAFSTQDTKNRKTLRRKRRAQATKQTVPSEAFLGEREDGDFWNQILDRQILSMPLLPASNPPVTPDTPSPTPATNPPVTPPAPDTPPQTLDVTICSATMHVDCVTIDGSQACTDIQPPSEGTGAACVREVEFSYTIKNLGTQVERIYSLEVTRGGQTQDITSTFPLTDLQPGQSTYVIQSAEIDVCQEGPDGFNTLAAFSTGPPCDVQVLIACFSEEGDECRQLPQAQTPDQCLIDITYTYTITNIGNVDANIILFTRTRNNRFLDLLPLLDDTSLPVDAQTSVQETEEIDRCVQQSFATNTIVSQLPDADLLCEDVGFYP